MNYFTHIFLSSLSCEAATAEQLFSKMQVVNKTLMILDTDDWHELNL